MAIVFQPDPSLAGFNAFCTTAFADDYQSTKLNTAWASALTADKEKLIIWASRQLSTLEFVGSLTDIQQPLAWPRKHVYIKGGTANSEVYDSYQFAWDEVPTCIREACADMAGALLEGDTTEASGTEGFSVIKVDSIELHIKSSDRLGWLPSSSRALLQRYLQNSSKYSVNTVRVG